MVARPARHVRRPAIGDLQVVPMRKRHLRGVLAIEQRVYPRPWSPNLFLSELAQPTSRHYVVALAGEGAVSGWTRLHRSVVGYAGVLVQVGEAHVTTVAVHPEHHRRKVATHLLIEILRGAIGLGAEAATLEVRVANRGAQRLYALFGFQPVGVRPGYYAETAEDALIMWAHDLRTPAFAALLDEQAARLGEPGGSTGAPDLHVPWVQGRVGLDGPGPTNDPGSGPATRPGDDR